MFLSVLGLDVITTSSIYGYEGSDNENHFGGKEKVILPDTSHFLHPSLEVNDGNKSIVIFKAYKGSS